MGADESGVEIAILGFAALAAAMVGSLWLGATVACLVAGHGGLGVGVVGAARAVPGLVSHPGSPGRAWGPPASGRLPGAALYWVCTAPVLAAALAAGLLLGSLIARRRTVGLEKRSRMGLNPEARFARAKDLAPLWVRGPTARRVILGVVAGHLMATEDSRVGLAEGIPWWLRRRAERRRGDRGAIVVLGPTRCGKTTALAVPAILEWDGPVIALSVKSDLMGATIDARRRRGDVKVFDPGDATSEETSAWSPLRDAKTLTGAKKAARALANATDWTSGSGDMAFWVAGAEDLLAPLLFVAANSAVGMAAVVSWVLKMDRPNEEGKGSLVATMNGKLCNHYNPVIAGDAQAAAELLSGTWGLDFRQLSSVYVTAKAMITAWQDPTVSGSSQGPPIDLDWLLDVGTETDRRSEADPAGGTSGGTNGGASTPAGHSGGGRGNTLYLCAPLHEAQRLAPVLGGLLGDLFDQTYERVGKSNEPVGPILVVVDEAGNWPLRNLGALASTCAGIGIQLMLIYQSKAQIDAVYGHHADTIISNCLTKVFFAGLSDRSTLDYAEGLLGSEQVLDRHSSVDVGGGTGRRSLSQSTTRAELLPMALLRQVRPGEALLVHNTLPPAHLIGRYWFKDRALYLTATDEALHPTRWKRPQRLALRPKRQPACTTCGGSGEISRRGYDRAGRPSSSVRPCPDCGDGATERRATAVGGGGGL